jgi:hypothetical protein
LKDTTPRSAPNFPSEHSPASPLAGGSHPASIDDRVQRRPSAYRPTNTEHPSVRHDQSDRPGSDGPAVAPLPQANPQLRTLKIQIAPPARPLWNILPRWPTSLHPPPAAAPSAAAADSPSSAQSCASANAFPTSLGRER